MFAYINLKFKIMKKLFTIFTVVVLSTTMSFAQQGTVVIGVGSNLADQSWQDYSLVPTVGYFMTDNIMVGTGFIMGYTKEESFGIEDEASGMSLSPFARLYLNEGMYISAGIAMTSSVSTDYNDDFNYKTEDKSSTFGVNAGIGYSLMWNNRICIEPSFGFATSGGSSSLKINDNGSVTETDSDAPSTFGLGIGLGIHIRLGGE